MAKHRNRASDAQRTAVLQALDTAFSEGRLDHFEHFERTRTATRAKYIDELRPLVADLRGRDADLGLDAVNDRRGRGHDLRGVDATAATAGAHPGRGSGNRSGRSRAWAGALGAAVAVLAIAGGAIAMSASDNAPDPGSSTTQTFGPGPLHTEDGVTRLLTETRSEFGDDGVNSMIIYGSYATLSEQDPADPDKRITHHFDGGWEERRFDDFGAESTLHVERIDAADVMAAISAAPSVLELDPDEAVTSHVQISADPLGDPEFKVSASEGEYGDLGTVVFGADAEVREVTMPD